MFKKKKYSDYSEGSWRKDVFINTHPTWLTEENLDGMSKPRLMLVSKSLENHPDSKVESTFLNRALASVVLSAALIYTPIHMALDDLGNNNLRDFEASSTYMLQTSANKDTPLVLHAYSDSSEFTILDCNEKAGDKGYLCKILSPEDAISAKSKEDNYFQMIETRLLDSESGLGDTCDFVLSRDINFPPCDNNKDIDIPEMLSVRSFSKAFQTSNGDAARYMKFEDTPYKFTLSDRINESEKLIKPVEYDYSSLSEEKPEPSTLQKHIYPKTYPFSMKSMVTAIPLALLSGLFAFASGAVARGRAENNVNDFVEKNKINDRLAAFEND